MSVKTRKKSIVMMVVLAMLVNMIAIMPMTAQAAAGDNSPVASVSAASGSGYDYSDKMPISKNPPGGLKPSQVPQFVVIGFDDNQYADGMNWWLDFVKGKKNPAGSGNSATFDGQQIHQSFYLTPTVYFEGSTPVTGEADVRASWKRAYDEGHEVGNHTYTHNELGNPTSVAAWQSEMTKCHDFLTKKCGIPASAIYGFRTPRLEYTSDTFEALKKMGYTYDCSIECNYNGSYEDKNGTEYVWPYTLDDGPNPGSGRSSGNHKGVWELPAYRVLDSGNNYYVGLDYNLWYPGNFTKTKFVDTLKYTLSQRMKGNRCPLLFGAHTPEYAAEFDKEQPSTAKLADKRKAFEEFVNYALTIPDVRIVSGKELIDWMRNPVPLGATVSPKTNTPTPTKATPSPTKEPNNDYSISGTVIPDVNSANVSGSLKAGFTVELVGTSTKATTDTNGSFEITGIKSGSDVTLKISKANYLYREIAVKNVTSNLKIAPVIDMWAGDLVADSAINMNDIMKVSTSFGSLAGDSKYVEASDINADGAINFTDIMIVADHFGKTPKDYPSIFDNPTPTTETTTANTDTPTPTKTTTVPPTKTPTPTVTIPVRPTCGPINPDFVARGPQDKPYVAITFDDGYDSASLERVLDVCKDSNVKITIFANSKYIKESPGIFKRAVSEGHLVCNHTRNHHSALKLGPTEEDDNDYKTIDNWIKGEVKGWEDDAKKVLGENYVDYMKHYFPLFRFPYGDGNEDATIKSKVKAAGYKGIVAWDVEGDTWSGVISKYENKQDARGNVLEDMTKAEVIADEFVNYTINNAANGRIFLMHTEIWDVLYFDRIIDGLKKKGLEPVSMAKMLGLKYTEPAPQIFDENTYPKLQALPNFSGNDPVAKKPFPYHENYGVTKIDVTVADQAQQDADTKEFYEQWKDRYLKYDPDTDGVFVAYNIEHSSEPENAVCVSEGQGYGMVIVALMAGADNDAKAIFDKMFKYYKAHPSKFNPYLMAWQQSMYDGHILDTIADPKNGVESGDDSATDGDMDIAYSLILADKQWGSSGSINYKAEAKKVIDAIMDRDVNKEKWNLTLGDWVWSSPEPNTTPRPDSTGDSRPSDYMFDHFKAFKEASGDARWDNVTNKLYDICDEIFKNYSSKTGLMPDFVVLKNGKYEPAPANYLEGPGDGGYDYNSCRTPWRFGTDALLYPDSRIKTQVKKMNSWIITAAKKDNAGKSYTYPSPSRIYCGYKLDGTPSADWSEASFVAPFMVAAQLGTDKAWLNDMYTYVTCKHVMQNDYFGNSIKMFTMLATTNNYWKP